MWTLLGREFPLELPSVRLFTKPARWGQGVVGRRGRGEEEGRRRGGGGKNEEEDFSETRLIAH